MLNRLQLLMLTMTACQTRDVSFTRGSDAAIDADVAVDVDAARPFVPLHIQPATFMSVAPDLILGSGPNVIDTTALTINGAASAYLVQDRDDAGNASAVLRTAAFAMQSPLRITGTLPLIIAATGRVTIAADIDLSAVDQVPGPGALTSGIGAGANGDSRIQNGALLSAGGGGGAYGTTGGDGGDVRTPPIGLGGLQYGHAPAGPLVGGSPGGRGGMNTPAGTGGGALQISSAVAITIASGIISSGGSGGHPGGNFGGGAGGGAGGEILLEAPAIVVLGTLVANGGGGGGGGAASQSGQIDSVGTAGEPGGTGPQPAAGGLAGRPGGGSGGHGAAGLAGSFSEAEHGFSGASGKGGGGGGGAGRIWLRYRATTDPDLTGAVISPPASTDPTLP